MATKPSVDSQVSDTDIVLETDKIIIYSGEGGMYGDVALSKLAPTYMHELIETSSQLENNTESVISSSFDSSCSRTVEELQDWKQKVQNEERLSRMYKLQRTFSLRFDNRAWLHPDGTTNFDFKAISEDRKENFEKFKNRIRLENYAYLGNHPEIQAIIALAIKKVLHALPPDPVKYLTEYLSTRMGNVNDFEHNVEEEVRKLSKYHISKMRAAGKVTLRPSTVVRSEISGESWRPEQDANYFKKLNIGALAHDFSFDASALKVKKKKEIQETLKLTRKKKKKSGPRKYCGCKDWKLKSNEEEYEDVMSEPEEEDDEEEEEPQTTTFSTLAHVNDNVLTSGEEEEGEEEQFGDGTFLGGLVEPENEHGNLTTAEAEAIAGMLVEELLGDGGGKIGGSGRKSKTQ